MAEARSQTLSVTERLLKNDRAILVAGLAGLVGLAALYTVFGVGMDMSALDMTAVGSGAATAMMAAPDWTAQYLVLIILMWWIMMIAMMTPSAAPLILLYSALQRRTGDAGRVPLRAAIFLSGYLMIWAGFSALATGLQWALSNAGLVSPGMMQFTSRALGGAVLVGAGLYQLTPLKTACLEHCRNPIRFLTERSRPGPWGALVMGVEHGTFCLGCCWAVMALLFFSGIMNLYWIAGLALYVLAEKLLPQGQVVARIAGAGLLIAGLYLFAGLAFRAVGTGA